MNVSTFVTEAEIIWLRFFPIPDKRISLASEQPIASIIHWYYKKAIIAEVTYSDTVEKKLLDFLP